MIAISRRTCTVLLILALPLWAAEPRVGLVKVQKGKVTLNGAVISTPQLAGEGETLVLAKGAEVRVQLLGSNKELTLRGPRRFTVAKAALQDQARAVKRGRIAAVPDIGTTTRGAALTTRTALGKSGPRGFRIGTTPTPSDQGWIFPLEVGEVFIEGRPRRADWSILRLELDGESPDSQGKKVAKFRSVPVAKGVYRTRADAVAVKGDALAPGQRYLVVAEVWYDDENHDLDPMAVYSEPFRLLTPEESEVLAALEADGLERSRAENSVAPLLDLAGVYMEWDQLQDAARIMKMATAHPEWSAVDKKTLESQRALETALNAIFDVTPADSDTAQP